MGLYDDNDSAVTRPVGGWAAASQQARNLQMHQKMMAEQRKQQQAIIQQSQQLPPQSPVQQKKPGFTPSKFMPMSRGSNLKKVPRPGYKPTNVTPRQKAKDESEYISRYQDEYDPIKPNEFSRYLRRRREGKHKVTRYAEQKKSQERDYKRQNPKSDSDSSEDEEKSKRQKAMGMGKAMIAPPSALYAGQSSMPNMPAAKNPDLGALSSKTASRTKTLGSKLGFGQPKPSLFGKSVPSTPQFWTPSSQQPVKTVEQGAADAKSIAERIMEKYGHKEGAGLGKSGQGIAAPLEVEKTSRRGGKIVGGQTASYGNFTSGGVQHHAQTPPPARANVGVTPPRPLPNLAKPTKVICLENMVDPEEIDGELSGEISGECAKYGTVANVKIAEVPNMPKEASVRIFIEFSRMEEAMKAVIGLHNRIFGGRRLIGGFYDFDQYSSGNVTEKMI
ncbi:unnamed protein product [Oikopleura dioica]|uniref:Splicing factor 45 n=2 Tax=Oikopleura dioica TaxID=34765 RepID=E4YXZ1_OIKDI|nr:unnamed protein product [Oikopleura dioica]